MKKLFLSLMMCTVSIALFADSTFAYDGVYYDTFSESLTARVATQSAYWNPSGDVVIHDEIEDPNGVVYTVTIIPFMAFYGSNIESISIPGTITSMGQFCIANCKSLKTITFADELTSIGSCAFTDDIALETIDLSNTVVTNISSQAFDGCTGLVSIVLPSTLTTLANYSLRNCTSLSSLTCLATTPPSLTTSTTPFTNVPVSTCTLYVPYGCKEAYAAATCWKDFSSIVELENDNTPLADGDTFEYDGIIYKVVSAEDKTVEVTYYGESYSNDDAIAYYTGDITIPASFEYMDATYIVIGVGDYAFYKSGVSSISFTTPSNVTYIGYRAMYNCTTITELTLPKGVLTVDNQSLRECTSMTTLNLPETVTYLGEYLCWGNTALTAINIPNSVTTLGKYVFNNCSTATELTLSPNITEWGSHAFYNCASLTSVEIPEGITEVGEYAFGNCDELVFVTIPDAVTTLGAHTFAACPKLESCVLPESMTEVDDYLFYNCPSLAEVTIGSKVESFGASVFAGCPALTAIYSLNPTPPNAPSSTFADTMVSTGTTDKETCVLYIPVGSYDDYSTADEWKDFLNIVEMTEFAIETLEATNVTDSSATLNGSVTEAYNDPITEKGFEYWTGSEEAKKVVVEGDEMSATVTDLTYDTQYTYRAYAIVESGITEYGEELTFTTEEPEGINNIYVDGDNVEGIYTIDGQQISTPQKGVNIVRYNDGTTKKILIK